MINEQTKGPVVYLAPGPITEKYPNPTARITDSGGHNTLAFVTWPVRNAGPKNVSPKVNSRFMVAAYNAFDKAARELGVDATELAEKVDLIEVLRRSFHPDNRATLTDVRLVDNLTEFGLVKHIGG